jgi:hypothetical protein
MRRNDMDKYPLKNRAAQAFAIVIISFLSLAMTGCGEWVLRADFNNYLPNISNTNLEGQILGKPNNDSIDNVQPPVQVKAGTPNNVLQIGADNEGGNIEFNTAPHDIPAEYRIDWNGNRVHINTGFTFVTFRDDDGIGDGNQAFLMRLGLNELDVEIQGQNVIQPIAFDPQKSHLITIVIKMDNPKQVEIHFKEDGKTTLRTFEPNPAFGKLTSIVFSTQPWGDYKISDLDVFAKN